METTTADEIVRVISSNFPALEKSQISEFTTKFADLNNDALEIILHAAKGALRRGERILIAYLGAAPGVYRQLGKKNSTTGCSLQKSITT